VGKRAVAHFEGQAMTHKPPAIVTEAEFDAACERGDAKTIARYLRQGGKIGVAFLSRLADWLDPPRGELRKLRFSWRG